MHTQGHELQEQKPHPHPYRHNNNKNDNSNKYSPMEYASDSKIEESPM